MNRRTDVSLISLLPVDFGWEIITMVNKALGSQLLFIPDHSHSPLFWHIKPWKNMKSPVLCCVVSFSLGTTASLSFPQLSLPSSHPYQLHGIRRGLSRWPSRPHSLTLPIGALWNDLRGTMYSEGFLCETVENYTLSDVHDLQLQALTGVRQLHSGFLFSTHCISKYKSLLALVICPPPICDTRKKVKEPWCILFVQLSDSWLNSFFKSSPKSLKVELIFLSGKGWSLKFSQAWSKFSLVPRVGLKCHRLTVSTLFCFFNYPGPLTQIHRGRIQKEQQDWLPVSRGNLGVITSFLQPSSLLPGAQFVSHWSLGSL